MNLTGVVKAICISGRRGIEKKAIPEAVFRENYGIEGDAHAGDWHRQVSLLSYDKVKEFNARGANVIDGAFGENLVVEGLDFRNLPVGTVLRCGEVVLKMTQIGKECHTHCAIYHRMGECIMPKQGVFSEVLRGGVIRPGDVMTAELPPADAPLRAAVLVASDKGSAGEREDLSGPAAKALLEKAGYEVAECVVVPDNQAVIAGTLIRLSDQRQVNLIITSGGTGMSPRDLTPEATLEVCERSVPGIPEAIRAVSAKYTKHAMLSRGVAGIRGGTLIVNLPGSPKAVEESLGEILPVLGHGLGLLRGQDGECAGRFANKAE